MKINIGAGQEARAGYRTMDIDPELNPDILADVTKPFPLEDESVDTFWASHIIEHLDPVEAGDFAKEVVRCLKVGGTLELSLPDIEEGCKRFATADEKSRWTYYEMLILGGRTNQWQIHKALWTPRRVLAYFQIHGLKPRAILKVHHGNNPLGILPCIYAVGQKVRSSTMPTESQE